MAKGQKTKPPVDAIHFGTDGWRGVIGEDFTNENVRKVAHAIARYVVRAEKPERGIVVGYDTRFGSEDFARVAAETVAAAGIPVWLSTSACPTPAVSLLVRQRQAAAGIQITASHNPYQWNGDEAQGELRQLRIARRSSPRWKPNSKRCCAMEFRRCRRAPI